LINGLIACLAEFFVIHVYGPAKVLNGAIDYSQQTAAIPRSPDGKSPCQSRAAIPESGNFWEKEENCKIVQDGSPREKLSRLTGIAWEDEQNGGQHTCPQGTACVEVQSRYVLGTCAGTQSPVSGLIVALYGYY